MSEITTTNKALTAKEIEVTGNLPYSNQRYVQLRQEKPISQLTPHELTSACFQILTKAFIDGTPNGAPDSNILTFQTKCLADEFRGRLAELTVSEVKEAFTRGIRGESGPYFGMCAKTYHQFLKWYHELPERSESWIKYLLALEDIQTTTKPVVLTQDYLIQTAKESFKNYKESGNLPFVPHAIYDTIKELLKVDTLIDKKDWPEVKELAKKACSEKHKPARGLKNGLNDALDFSLSNRSFEFHVKKQGLIFYFKRLIAEGKELEF